MDWQQLFQEHILERGYDYYCEGAVEEFEQEENIITASVCGTEDYEVQIKLQDTSVVEMECSCPYAEKGLSCKHMAAV